jgi:hypothetical protein
MERQVLYRYFNPFIQLKLFNPTEGATKARFSLNSLTQKYLRESTERFPTVERETAMVQRLVEAMAANQGQTAAAFVRRCPEVMFEELRDMMFSNHKTLAGKKPLLPMLLLERQERRRQKRSD